MDTHGVFLRIYDLDLGGRKFAVDIALACGSGYINRKPPPASVSVVYPRNTPGVHGIYITYIYIYILLGLGI